VCHFGANTKRDVAEWAIRADSSSVTGRREAQRDAGGGGGHSYWPRIGKK
jgi:uncharacterized protein involved in type VI secretion and phage assembly